MGEAVTKTNWPNLTAALAEVDGPPRRLLDRAFPHRRPTQDTYRRSAGPIRVLGGAANAGTVGTAFDVWVQLQIQPRPEVSPATLGAHLTGQDAVEGYSALCDRLGPGGGSEPVVGSWTGPSDGYNERDLFRFCWAAAALSEVYRAGLMSGSPLLTVDDLRNPEALLAMAPPGAVDDLYSLARTARTRLLPTLHDLTTRGPTWSGPTFAGSALMKADADLVVGHTLVELKTNQGDRNRKGARRLGLTGPLLSQLLGYVLHDHDDAHEIRSVAVYQARYGHLATWELSDLLRALAGRDVDVADLRQQWAGMLETGGFRPRLQ